MKQRVGFALVALATLGLLMISLLGLVPDASAVSPLQGCGLFGNVNDDWRTFALPDGTIIWRPVMDVLVRGADGLLPANFLVDSGADLSMAPYDLFRKLGKRREDGQSITLHGISRRKVCAIEGRVTPWTFSYLRSGGGFTIPVCFARGKVPFLLGQEGFFDHFIVRLGRSARKTTF
jgi:hypothetical protein